MNYYWKNKTIYISINDFSVDFFNELPKLDIEINKNSVVFGEIIHLKIGMPKNTNKQNNEKPLIEEQYENKWKNILQIKKLAGIDVQVIQHKAKHLWQTWIVIMASRKPQFTTLHTWTLLEIKLLRNTWAENCQQSREPEFVF